MRRTTRDIALLHYAAPPVVGGVESVMGHQARLMAAAGHHVRVVAGCGGMLEQQVRYIEEPLLNSRHPEILAAKALLDVGNVPVRFDHLVGQIMSALEKALAGVEIVIAHNVCSLHKNLSLTAALRHFCISPSAPRLIAWHHDLAWKAPRYASELHAGWPWDLLRDHWSDTQIQHVAVSELRRQELCDLLSLQPEQIAVIPSGVDAQSFLKLEPQTTDLVEELCLMQAHPLLLLPVRITARKNIELALRVLSIMGNWFPRVALVIVGPPGPHNPDNLEYFECLKRLRNELGVKSLSSAEGPAVCFLADHVDGYLPDVVIGDFLRMADALFLPSREEGFGIPVLEAGLLGLPIYCSDIAALREIAGDMAIYFSPNDDPFKIAERVSTHLCSLARYKLRAHVRENYTWESVYANYIEPLLEVGQ